MQSFPWKENLFCFKMVEGNEIPIPARCISLLQEVQNLIEAQKSGPENIKETAAFTSNERQAVHPSNNSREIITSRDSRELWRISDHSLLHNQPPVPLTTSGKNLGPFRSKRCGLTTFSVWSLHKLLLSHHMRKMCCRMLGLDDGKCFFLVKELLSIFKPGWKVFTQNWKAVVGLNCREHRKIFQKTMNVICYSHHVN